jgi:hypothetical protein
LMLAASAGLLSTEKVNPWHTEMTLMRPILNSLR